MLQDGVTKCDVCDGTGNIPSNYMDRSGMIWTEFFSCSPCEGRGVLGEPEDNRDRDGQDR